MITCHDCGTQRKDGDLDTTIGHVSTIPSSWAVVTHGDETYALCGKCAAVQMRDWDYSEEN